MILALSNDIDMQLPQSKRLYLNESMREIKTRAHQREWGKGKNYNGFSRKTLRHILAMKLKVKFHTVIKP